MNLPKTQQLLPRAIENRQQEMELMLEEYVKLCQQIRKEQPINKRAWNEKSMLLEVKFRKMFPSTKRNVNPFIAE